MARPLINVPVKVKRGETFEIKTCIPRHGAGLPLYHHRRASPARYRDVLLVPLQWRGSLPRDLSPAIAANPFVTFFTVAKESGTLEFKSTGDNGFPETAVATITVE